MSGMVMNMVRTFLGKEQPLAIQCEVQGPGEFAHRNNDFNFDMEEIVLT